MKLIGYLIAHPYERFSLNSVQDEAPLLNYIYFIFGTKQDLWRNSKKATQTKTGNLWLIFTYKLKYNDLKVIDSSTTG